MEIDDILKNIPKKTRNPTTVKYGMFGLALGEITYKRLNDYCKHHNISKASLVKSLVIKYLDTKEIA
jgi:hypothetical protein